jgi:hypothetical protein
MAWAFILGLVGGSALAFLRTGATVEFHYENYRLYMAIGGFVDLVIPVPITLHYHCAVSTRVVYNLHLRGLT